MVWSDVEQDGHIGTELIHIVELETAQLDDVVLMRSFSHLKGQTLSDVACQTYIIASRLDDVVNHRGSGCLTVTSRDTDHLGISISARKFYFADDRCTLSHQFLYHRCFLRNTRTLDDFICI